MENHIAREHHAKAAEYAMEALRRDPNTRNAFGELIYAMNGKISDWNGSSHYALIDFYESYIEEHPNCRNAHMDIIDQLLDDYRIEEAMHYWKQMSRFDESYRIFLYRGKIAWQDGNREEAFRFWNKMEEQFPNEWCVYHHIGDYLLKDGKMDQVAAYYRKAMDGQKAPRLVDPLEALAQYYERIGDYVTTIDVLNEELDIFDKEWNFIEGESADVVRREIARISNKIKKREVK